MIVKINYLKLLKFDVNLIKERSSWRSHHQLSDVSCQCGYFQAVSLLCQVVNLLWQLRQLWLLFRQHYITVKFVFIFDFFLLNEIYIQLLLSIIYSFFFLYSQSLHWQSLRSIPTCRLLLLWGKTEVGACSVLQSSDMTVSWSYLEAFLSIFDKKTGCHWDA